MRFTMCALLVVLVAGCAGSPNATTTPATPTPLLSQPSLPIPVPDLPSGEPLTLVGETLTVGDNVFTWNGLETRADGQYATFRVQSGSLDGAQLLAGGALLPLRASADGYEAGPFSIEPDAHGGGLMLQVGDALVVLEAAPRL